MFRKINQSMKKIFLRIRGCCYIEYPQKILLALCMVMVVSVFSFQIRANTDMVLQQSDVIVTGVVKDTKGEVLIGVNVFEKEDPTNGVITGVDGSYSIKVSSGNAKLTFSFIGFQNQTVDVGGRLTIDITLLDESIGLNEVVAVGYGSQTKATITGSISKVSGEEITKSGATDLTNALVGRTAGIIANNRSGEPGSDGADILIRGKGTWGNNAPLVVIDGVADRGGFGRLNPNDIESISILKDAAAAIYGVKAANGVILVKTKRGNKGKPTIKYSGDFGLSQPTRVPEMMNAWQFATWQNEYNARHNSAVTFSDEDIRKYKEGTDPLTHPNVDWWDETTKDWAYQTQHSVSLSGGSDKVNYYLSGQYLEQDAIFKNSAYDYKQYQFKSNIDAKVTDAITFSVDVLGRQEVRNRGRYGTQGYGLMQSIFASWPIVAPYYPNGLPRIGYDGRDTNPVFMVSDAPGYNETTYSIFNLKPNIKIDLGKIVDGLYVEGWAAFDIYREDNKTFNKPFDLYLYNPSTEIYENKRDVTGNINLYQSARKRYSTTYNARIGYTNRFGQHKVDAFAAYEQYETNNGWFSATRKNFLSPTIDEMFAGGAADEDMSNDGASYEDARQNIFGRVNYSLKDRYLLEFSMRYDRSMIFPKENRDGYFPAVSMGWRISEEDFFKGAVSFVNYLKFKGSWGQMGNDQVYQHQFLTLYQFALGHTFGVDNTRVKGFQESTLPNPNITWEVATTINGGFESQFFDGKYGLDFDYFYSKRDNILLGRSASIPKYTGIASLPDENIGKVDNYGCEVVAYYKNQIGDFKYRIDGNFTFARNKVIFKDEADDIADYQKAEGMPIDTWMIYGTDGLFQTQEEIDNSPHIPGTLPGDIRYIDKNGDGEITGEDQYRIDQTRTPQIMYGTSLSGEYKNFDFSILFQGQAMAKQMVMINTMNGPAEFFNGRWSESNTPEQNANAKYPRAFVTNVYPDTYNGRSSTFWLKDGGFLRLKNVEIGYSLPDHVCDKLKIQGLRTYVNGHNLFTIDDIKIMDPESPSGGGVNFYPQQRTIKVGLNLTL